MKCISIYRVLLCIILITIALLSAGCVTSDIPQKSTIPEKVNDLNWLKFTSHPAKFEIENAYQIDELDNIILYFSLSNTTLDIAEFAYYFPEYAKAANEFERRDVAKIINKKIEAKKKMLLSQDYLVAKIDTVYIGEYSFNEQGFPLFITGLLLKDDERGMMYFARFSDHTTSMDAALSSINQEVKEDGFEYSALSSFMIFDNLKNKSINITLVPVDEPTAKSIISEFGYYENPRDKAVAEMVGKQYKGYKTAIAFVLFKPISANPDKSMLAGVRYESKDVHGIAKYIVLATQRGTVFGVYPSSEGN